MELLIVTGLSGAGKSRAVDALEDIGFFCVDNMPPKLISRFAEMARQSEGRLEKIAMVSDVRGGELFNDFQAELGFLESHRIPYKLLFLDCDTQTLLRRYKETRRRHPLMDAGSSTIENAVRQERELLRFARERADYIIDTTDLTAVQLRERVNNTFLENAAGSMLIYCMSFGFKYGPPSEADLVFDVRCLPNPFYVDELKQKNGLDSEVRNYVMQFPQSEALQNKLFDLIDFLIPLYQSEGKSQLTIACGCTGGHHRSVAFTEAIRRHLDEQGKKASAIHRDIAK